MSKWLCFALLAFAALTAHAAPAAAEDDMGRFMADRGLLGRIEQVRSTVADRTSELVINAMAFLGVPYRRGGNNADTGFDCSGFVRSIYERTVGLVLPRLAKDQAAATQPIDERDLQPGDLVFFNGLDHVGIWIGGNEFVDAPHTGSVVSIEKFGSWYASHYVGARRI